MTIEMLGRTFSVEEWESLCTRCGLCCYEKVETHGLVVATDTPCRFLRSDMSCRVYPYRHQVCTDCHDVTPEVVLARPYLPADCGYVQLARQLAEEQGLPGPPTLSEAGTEERTAKIAKTPIRPVPVEEPSAVRVQARVMPEWTEAGEKSDTRAGGGWMGRWVKKFSEWSDGLRGKP